MPYDCSSIAARITPEVQLEGASNAVHPCTNAVKIIIIIIIIIRTLITRAMSEYMTECEARAVAMWDVGSCLRMVHKTKQVGFEPVFESLYSWSIS